MSDFYRSSEADAPPPPRRKAAARHAATTPSWAKPVGVALSDEHLTVLLADRSLTARLNAAGLAFAIAGIDQVDRALPRQARRGTGTIVEPSVAAAMLAANAPDLRWLAAAVQRNDTGRQDRPAVPAGYLPPAGRPGVLLGLHDEAPVLAWRVENTGEAAAARDVADVIIWPAGRPERLAQIAAAGSDGPRLFLEMPAGGSDPGARLAGHLADRRVAAVVLRPAGSEADLRAFVLRVLPELAGSGVFTAGWSGTLRQRLSLPAPEPVPATGMPATGLSATGLPATAFSLSAADQARIPVRVS
jgi:hypothetical protein